jgi:hypothetical protein
LSIGSESDERKKPGELAGRRLHCRIGPDV